MKLLCFINNENIDDFYLMIKKQYKKNFPKFFIYFENTYLFSRLFSDLIGINYNERYIDITKSLEYYFKNKKDLKLIQEEDIYYIMEEYNKYRKKIIYLWM